MFKKTGQKFAYEVLVPTIKKNLTRRRSEFDKVVKSTNKALEGLSKEAKVDIKSKGGIKKTVGKISKLIDEADKKNLDLTEKKAKGGRIGLRLGSKKSNIQKIQEAFGPKQTKKKDKVKRMMAKKGSPDPKKKKKFPDLTGDGKVTFADILKGRGVINGKKKKTKKKFI
jgi:hypothetical protein